MSALDLDVIERRLRFGPRGEMRIHSDTVAELVAEVRALRTAAETLLRCMDDAHTEGETVGARVSVAARALQVALEHPSSVGSGDSTS